MTRYLENPQNAVTFVSYSPQSSNKLERIVHLDHVYNKIRSTEAVPNLICIGSPRTGKSRLLNGIFKTEFEELNESSIAMFHDCMEAVFHSA